MKLVVVFVLVALCQTQANVDDSDMQDLARQTMQEVSRRMKTDLNYESLQSFKTKKEYNSAIASHRTIVNMQMRARRNDGHPVGCSAEVAVLEGLGPDIRGYSCQEQRNGGFWKRSGETPCAEEQDAIFAKAKEIINENIDNENAAMNMPGMMDMPELQQSHFTFGKLLSCTKVVSDEGTKYKLTLDANQDGTDESCDVEMIKGPGNHFDVTQNQCQGIN